MNANGEAILQLAVWAPVGNSIAFVARNNIFYRPSATSLQVKQITKNGIIGNIYNGVPDWVYEGTYLYLIYVESTTSFAFRRSI